MRIEKRLNDAKIQIPTAPKPVANFLPAVRVGNLLYVSGHGPIVENEPKYVGKVGMEVSFEDALSAARLCALNCLAAVKQSIGTLGRVKRVVKVNGYVNAVDGFQKHSLVMDGASNLLVEIFGEAGKHARCTVGVSGLNRGFPVEVEMLLEVG